MLSLSERAGLGRAVRSLQRLQSLERTATMHLEDRGATTIQQVYTTSWLMQTFLQGLIHVCQRGQEGARIQLGNIN